MLTLQHYFNETRADYFLRPSDGAIAVMPCLNRKLELKSYGLHRKIYNVIIVVRDLLISERDRDETIARSGQAPLLNSCIN